MQDLIEPLGHPSLSPLIDVFNLVGRASGVDPCLLAAIAEEESTWNKLALSFDGNYGRGLMQIDSAFHAFADLHVVYKSPIGWVTGGNRTGRAVDVAASVASGANVFDAHENVRYACESILCPAFTHFADRADAVVCVIASYNAGIGGVNQALAAGRTPESATYDKFYVPKITASHSWFLATSAANEAAKHQNGVGAGTGT